MLQRIRNFLFPRYQEPYVDYQQWHNFQMACFKLELAAQARRDAMQFDEGSIHRKVFLRVADEMEQEVALEFPVRVAE